MRCTNEELPHTEFSSREIAKEISNLNPNKAHVHFVNPWNIFLESLEIAKILLHNEKR